MARPLPEGHARRRSRRLASPHLDTGLLYRPSAKASSTWPFARAEVEAADAAAALDHSRLDVGLARRRMGEAASLVAAQPAVRAALFIATRFRAPARRRGLDGRDIGTVICPDAEVKIFVTATARGGRTAPLARARARRSAARLRRGARRHRSPRRARFDAIDRTAAASARCRPDRHHASRTAGRCRSGDGSHCREAWPPARAGRCHSSSPVSRKLEARRRARAASS